MLTGAGFTYNMGGYLGAEMHTVISNHKLVRSNQALRAIMLSELLAGRNFESAYARVLAEETFSQQERDDLTNAIVDAYRDMHEEIMHFRSSDHPDHFNFRPLTAQLAGLFNSPGNERCMIFTLNQDLFFEYWSNWHAPAAPKIGGGNQLADRAAFKELPHEVTMEDVEKGIKDHAGPAYIKLHGSYGWLASNGKHSLVIGTQKEKQIQDEPLLRWYYQLYKDILQRTRGMRLLIIGYGFGDPHINETLKIAVEVMGTKLFIINPRNQGSFIQYMNKIGAAEIAAGIECYYPWKLRDIFFTEKSRKWGKIQADILN